jgi:hypothetical protein
LKEHPLRISNLGSVSAASANESYLVWYIRRIGTERKNTDAAKRKIFVSVWKEDYQTVVVRLVPTLEGSVVSAALSLYCGY